MSTELNAVDAVAIGLATFYLAFVLTRTHGPFNAFKIARERWPLGGLTTCMYCMCVWAGILAYVLLIVAPPALYVIAAAGASAGLYRWTGADLT